MSIYMCDYCNQYIDADYNGCCETPDGECVCENCYTDIGECYEQS